MYNGIDFNDTSKNIILEHANSYFDRKWGAHWKTNPNSQDYVVFFSTDNFTLIMKKLECMYDIEFNTIDKYTLLDTMTTVYFDYKRESELAKTLFKLNNMVILNMKRWLSKKKEEQHRYQTNIIENQKTTFLHFMERPQNVTTRRDMGGVSDVLFGTKKTSFSQPPIYFR